MRTRALRGLAAVLGSSLTLLAGITAVRASSAVAVCTTLQPAAYGGIRKFPSGDPLLLTFLAVKITEDRTFVEFDLSEVPESGSKVMRVGIVNIDTGDDSDGVIDVFAYPGDGAITPSDFFAGTTPFASFVWNVGEDAGEARVASIDLTTAFSQARASGWRYLGIRLSTTTRDRFDLGSGWGYSIPDPYLTVCQESPGDVVDTIEATLPHSVPGTPALRNQLSQAETKLADAEASLVAGDARKARNDFCQARSKLDAFAAQVASKVNDGSLDPVTGGSLTDLARQAQALIDGLLSAAGLAPC